MTCWSARAGRTRDDGQTDVSSNQSFDNAFQGIDLLLSGHLHSSRGFPSSHYFQFEHRAALFIEAGTATSTRHRGQTNSFNLIRLDGTRVSVSAFYWDPWVRGFYSDQAQDFELWSEGWSFPRAAR